MSEIDNQVHDVDKRLAIIEHEVQELCLSVIDLKDSVSEIHARHHLEDYKTDRRAKLFDFSLKNWKILLSIVVIIGGLYEAGRALYLAPSPKYNASSEVKYDKPNR